MAPNLLKLPKLSCASLYFKKHKTTFFGFKEVELSEKQNNVNEVFANVAKKYDTMNDLMSGYQHRFWKNHFVKKLRPTIGETFLDLAGGTGDIAFRIADTLALNLMNSGDKEPLILGKHGRIIVSDISPQMIEVGKQREESLRIEGLEWLVADASNIPLESNSVDAVTIAFGLRNTPEPQKVLTESLRVLKKGGRFLCLEFSNVPNPILSKAYDIYSFNIIPVMGSIIAGDWNSYQYLVESIRVFLTKQELATLMETIGMRIVTYEDILGGVVSIHQGYKID